MKRRTGFVSNSSSSSFIIALPKKPESKEDIHKFFFSAAQIAVTTSYGEDCFPIAQVVGTLFHDLADPITKEKAVEIAMNGYVDGHPDMDVYRNRATSEYDWDAYEKASKEHATKVMNAFMEKNKGKVFFHYTYGDNDGAYFACLENSHFWDAVPYLRISHH